MLEGVQYLLVFLSWVIFIIYLCTILNICPTKNLAANISAKLGTWPTNGAVVGNNEAKNSSKNCVFWHIKSGKMVQGTV